MQGRWPGVLRAAAAALAIASLMPTEAMSQSHRPRARDIGVAPGIFEPGVHNAITDVLGVRVGHATVWEGDSIRTGVTVILPHGGDLFEERVPAAIHTANGFGKLVGLTQVAFKSAFMYNIKEITELAHEAGALTLWDLCHSVGAVRLKLNEWKVDLAVGCTYKYLNGGPGSPAFLYVRKDLQKKLFPPIWGWFADQAPFEFNLDFIPADGISRFQISTPHILSMAGIEPALEILLEADIEKLRGKSVEQTEYLIYLAQENLLPLGFKLGSPLDSAQRGSHVSLRHPEAYRICRALIDPNPDDTNLKVIPDFRAPDNIRLGIAPLYTTYSDIHQALNRIKTILEDGIYQEYSNEQLKVT